MLRPILLLLLACMAVTVTLASEVSMDLEDREDREDMLEVEDRDALADIEEMEEAEKIEETATEEELQARADMEEDRLGNPTHPAEHVVDCGKWTNRVVEINNATNSCAEVQLTCSKFFVDNRDPYLCRVGDAFYTRPSKEVPKAFCKRDGPTHHFPVLSKGELKVWYKRSIGVLGLGRYPKKGVRCLATCSKPIML